MSIALPPEWCEIPAGYVTLTDATKREGTPGGTILVEAFAIAKYPITNRQFDAYLEAVPHEVEETAYAGDDLPRTNVSWFEASAFCEWLTAQVGSVVQLPTEVQWQRAAQGDTGWAYPWGNEIDASRCNYDSRHKGVTPVTAFPTGVSPFGVWDMSGNVFEWCADSWGTTYTGPLSRTLRGGSWNHGEYNARVTFRGRGNPQYGTINAGFRPVLLATATR